MSVLKQLVAEVRTLLAETEPKLGSGTRFKKLTAAVASRGDVDDPEAVAASIGRAKYGRKKMAALAAAGKK
jgi:hypothetical protein